MKPRIITGGNPGRFPAASARGGAPPYHRGKIPAGDPGLLPGACAGTVGHQGDGLGLEGGPGPALRPQHRQRQAGGPEHLLCLPGLGECRVKPLRRQRELFRDPGRELDKGDYLHLLDAARKTGNWRLYYLMETLASTGVRVSELQYVTVQALHTSRAWVEGRERAAWSSSPPNCAGRWGSTAGSGALSPARCLSPGAAGRWTGPTSGGRCGPSAPRRGWRPSGSFPTTSATSSPGRFMPWRRTSQSWRTSWATPAWRRRESISWRAARNTRARWSDWAWSSDHRILILW